MSGQDLDRPPSEGVVAGVEPNEDLGNDCVLVTEQTQEKVFGSNISVTQSQGLFRSIPKYRLRSRA